MVPFTDISKHQGPIDFRKMAANNVAGVIIRAGNGTRVDPMLRTYMLGAKAAGLKVGVYWFCNPRVGTAKQQGEMLAAAHLAWDCDLPPMLDVESYLNEAGSPSDNIFGERYAAWLMEMALTVDEITDRLATVYTNKSYWDGSSNPRVKGAPPNVGSPDFGSRDLICARYPFYSYVQAAIHVPPLDAQDWDEWIMAETDLRPQVPRGWSTWQAWQFSAGYNGRGPAYGCTSADLDLNICRDDVWERWTSEPVTTQPPVVVVPEPHPITPPTTESDLMHVLLEVHDAQGRRLDAMFYATLDNRGIALHCEWTGDGNPNTPTGRKLQDHIKLGMEVKAIGIGSFQDITRLGPRPPAEAFHIWADSDWARVIG